MHELTDALNHRVAPFDLETQPRRVELDVIGEVAGRRHEVASVEALDALLGSIRSCGKCPSWNGSDARRLIIARRAHPVE